MIDGKGEVGKPNHILRSDGKRRSHVRSIRIIGITAVLAVALTACSSSTKGLKSTSTGARTNAPTTAPTTAVATSGLSGTWSGQYSGAYQGTFILIWQQSGSDLSGTINLSTDGTPSVNGTVSGSSIRFGTVGSSAITYTGTVSGNSMSGSYQTPGGGGSWSASKTS